MPSIINALTASGGGVAITGDATGNLALQTAGNTAATVNTSKGVQFDNCIGVGNATPSTSGAGITFPATQSASTDANTLDDYEEGSWTPAYAFSTSGSVTYTLTSGRYTKVGNIVHASCRIATSAISSPTGNVSISGLPFTSASGSNYGVAIGQASGFAAAHTIRAQIEPSSAVIDFLKNASNTGGTALQGSDFASGATANLIDLTVTYRAA